MAQTVVQQHGSKVADSILAVGAMTVPAWLDDVASLLEVIAVGGGIVILCLRGWLIWQEIKRNRKKEEDDGGRSSDSGSEPS